MVQLLKTEWLKAKNYGTFWVLTGLFAVLLPLFNYQYSSGMAEGGKMLGFDYGFPNVWGNFGFWASWFVLFIAFLIVILITNEFRYRTNRQNVIDGWTRMQSFHAKCGFVLMMAAGTTIYVGIWCLIFGAGYSGGFDAVTTNMYKLFYFFVLCLNYFGLAAMISFLVKRSGLSIGLFMLYALIFENIARSYINWQIPGKYIGNFLPLQSSDELLPFSLMKQAEGMVMKGTPPPEWSYLLASCCYIVLYYFISKRKLTKSDW
jgi:ABC-2 type transport system permease protein